MGFRIAARWFEHRRLDHDVSLVWEPHADPFARCNMWHVRGRVTDLLIDRKLQGAVRRSDASSVGLARAHRACWTRPELRWSSPEVPGPGPSAPVRRWTVAPEPGCGCV